MVHRNWNVKYYMRKTPQSSHGKVEKALHCCDLSDNEYWIENSTSHRSAVCQPRRAKMRERTVRNGQVEVQICQIGYFSSLLLTSLPQCCCDSKEIQVVEKTPQASCSRSHRNVLDSVQYFHEKCGPKLPPHPHRSFRTSLSQKGIHHSIMKNTYTFYNPQFPLVVITYTLHDTM